MTWLLGLAAAFLLAVAGFSVYRAFQNPVFYGKLLQLIWTNLSPAIARALHPKPFTPEQLERLRAGKDPFRKRPDEGGHR